MLIELELELANIDKKVNETLKGSVHEKRKPYECDSSFDLNENIETNKARAVHEEVFITKDSLLNHEASIHAENVPLENHIENEHTYWEN